MIKKIFTITLNPAFDVHCYGEDFNLYCENFAKITSKDAGGKGINISRALFEHDTENTAIVVLGDENKSDFQEKLDQYGIKYFPISARGQIRENITIHTGIGKETRLSFIGNIAINDCIINSLKDAIGDAKDSIITFTGSLPDKTDKNKIILLIKHLKKAGAKIVIDSKSFDLKDILECTPWLIKPNEEEILVYAKRKISSVSDALESAREIHKSGVENVIISMGGKGAVLSSQSGDYYSAAPKVSVISTIGAGDSMIAGFINAYCAGETDAECLKNAVAFGTAACMTNGTNPPRKDDVKKLVLEAF